MSMVGEVGKATGGFIDAMKREPLSLALVVMNLAMLAFFYFLLTTVASQREREINLLYSDKKEVRELLSRCVVPDRERRGDNSSSNGKSPLFRLQDNESSPVDASQLFKLPP